MKILQVSDQKMGGQAGYNVFAEALANGATLGWQLVQPLFQSMMRLQQVI